jgi:hypothetical protein
MQRHCQQHQVILYASPSSAANTVSFPLSRQACSRITAAATLGKEALDKDKQAQQQSSQELQQVGTPTTNEWVLHTHCQDHSAANISSSAGQGQAGAAAALPGATAGWDPRLTRFGILVPHTGTPGRSRLESLCMQH